MPNICLIDMKNMAFRAGFGAGVFYGPEGDVVSVLVVAPLMILDLMAHVGDAIYIGIWDGAPPHLNIPERINWRKLYARLLSYKDNRKPTPETGAIRRQLPLLAMFLDLIGMPQYGVPGVEADDLIGILSRVFRKRGDTVYFYSNDSDLLQLVSNDGIFGVVPTMGDGIVTYDESHVVEKLGVAPDTVAKLKALMGDSSDGYKPIRGVGKERALRFLAEGLDPTRGDFEMQPVYHRNSLLQGSWPYVQEAYLLARIPRASNYRYFPEVYQLEIRAVLREAVRLRRTRYVRKDLDNRLKHVIGFCSRYGLSGALVRRREFFQFARVED